ncbi:unnamed protein product [Pylaiella littoralis]
MPEFHFMESDWGVHAKRGGSICAVSALASCVFGFVSLYLLGAFLALAIALLLATFEVPWVYKWFEPCRRLKDILNETLKFSVPGVRAVLYLCLAILAFWSYWLNIVLGVLLVLTAILYAFAQIVGAAITDTSDVPDAAAPADGQTPFGTFT